jgi:hypothetical protein
MGETTYHPFTHINTEIKVFQIIFYAIFLRQVAAASACEALFWKMLLS